MAASFALLYSLEELYNPELTVKIIGHQWYWTYEIAHRTDPSPEDYVPPTVEHLIELEKVETFLTTDDDEIAIRMAFLNPSKSIDELETLIRAKYKQVYYLSEKVWLEELRIAEQEQKRTEVYIEFDSYMRQEEDLSTETLRLLEVDRALLLPVHTPIRLNFTGVDVIHSWAVPAFGIKTDCIPGRLNQTPLYILQEVTVYGQCSELCGINHGFMPISVTATR